MAMANIVTVLFLGLQGTWDINDSEMTATGVVLVRNCQNKNKNEQDNTSSHGFGFLHNTPAQLDLEKFASCGAPGSFAIFNDENVIISASQALPRVYRLSQSYAQDDWSCKG
ncbi:hypothetical protein BJ165DRAFT_1496965 [Panaeolus papilionaceus]|nr:hypothetical protein BJ165DRAFT_1496965 [Panaeolus papilionaceus]